MASAMNWLESPAPVAKMTSTGFLRSAAATSSAPSGTIVTLSVAISYCLRMTLRTSRLVPPLDRPTTPMRCRPGPRSSRSSLPSWPWRPWPGVLGLGLGGRTRGRHDQHRDVLAQHGDRQAALRHRQIAAHDGEIGLAARRSQPRSAAGPSWTMIGRSRMVARSRANCWVSAWTRRTSSALPRARRSSAWSGREAK